jgi:outer membrane protein, heavy metal efflux system
MRKKSQFRLLFVVLTRLIGCLLRCAAGAQVGPGASAHREAVEGQPLTLQDLIAEVQRANAEIQAARARLEASKARIPQARALPDPMVSVGYTNDSFRRLTLGSSEDTSLGVSVAQEIPFPPKLALKGKVTEQDWQCEAELLRATELDVISRLKVAYNDLFFVERSLEIVERNRHLLQQFAQTAESRYAVGQDAQRDVLRAYGDYHPAAAVGPA